MVKCVIRLERDFQPKSICLSAEAVFVPVPVPTRTESVPRMSLEGKFGYQRDAARVAGKYSLGIIEDRVTRSQIVQVARTIGPRKE